MRQTADARHDIGHFEHWSKTYERSWMQRWLFDPVHAAVLDAAGDAPASLLDVGCGTGRLLRDAHARWPDARLFGVDPASGMVDVARELTPYATLTVGTAEALPLPDGAVSLAVSTLSFHHWRDQNAGLREIARVLQPGGRFILADVTSPALLARLFGNPRARDLKTRRRMLAEAGLRLIARRSVRSPFVVLSVAVRAGA